MKTKLTLVLDSQVVISAKKYSQLSGKSLSGIVENYLKTITSSTEIDLFSPKITRMMGVIKLPEDFDHKKELGRLIDKRQDIR